MNIIRLAGLLLLLTAPALYAGEADVVKVDVERTGTDTFHFEVAVLHHDEGWNHYADKWDVVAPDGRVLATRTLYHPMTTNNPSREAFPASRYPPASTR